jgi:hypothetical protein
MGLLAQQDQEQMLKPVHLGTCIFLDEVSALLCFAPQTIFLCLLRLSILLV